ncbi:acyl-CoA dehydrogenase family protein [Chloroflexota bacterium]
MDFGFSAEQLRFRREVADFCLSRPKYQLVDTAEEWFYSPEYYRDLVAKGWIGLHWPRQYGGQGRNWLETVILNEELAYHGAPLGDLYYATIDLFGDFCLAHGSEQQRRNYLPRVTGGEIRAARAYTEPDAGYDLAVIETYARADGDDYVINGRKRFITGANVADYLFLLARTDRDAVKGKGISMFAVDTTTPGLTVTPLWSVAMRTNEVFLDDVRVPQEALLGEKGQALEYIDQDPHFRYEISLGSGLGEMRRTFNRLVRYVKKDEQRHLGENRQIRYRLADVAIDIQVMRLMTYRVAWMRSEGLVPQCEVYMQKICQAQLEQRMPEAAMEIFGLLGQIGIGSGYAPMRGMMAIRSSASLLSFLPGSSEILRTAIATKHLGLP